MEKRFWKPSLTSQYHHCPIPYHMDTYRGCSFNCTYCFARDLVAFHRRNKNEHEKKFTYLVGNRGDLLKKWIEKVENKELDYNKPEEVAFKERIPIKLGATADPFPYIENKEKVTFEILQIFHEYDYPIEIQTKNPAGICKIADDFINPNWTIAVTLISTDEDFLKVCEPSAPTARQRLDAIKELTDKGFKVMIKIQPATFPRILEDLPALIDEAKKAGCWSINIEGLKVRISMSDSEKAILKKMSDYVGYDIRDYYKTNGVKTGTDWEINPELKKQYISKAKILCKLEGLKFFVADNHLMEEGCNSECCGTEVLRDYKIWGNNERSRLFPEQSNFSTELGKCSVNFVRSKKNAEKTMNQMVDEKRKKE